MRRKRNLRESPENFGLVYGLVEERVKAFISLHLKNSLRLLYLISDIIVLAYDYLNT